SAIPVPDPSRRRERILLPGEIPSPINPPTGCRFHTRCNVVMPHCGWSPRVLAGPAAYLFDPTRNPEAAELSIMEEVVISSRRLLRKEFAISLVHRLEVRRIREEHGRPDNGAHRESQFLQDGLNVAEALMRLTADVGGGPFSRLRTGEDRRLSGYEDETVRD